MDYQTLNTELTTDPLGRGYAGMTDEQAAADLNTVYRTRDRAILTGAQIWEQTQPSEYNALTDAQKNQWIGFCGISVHDPFGPSAQFVLDLFGGGSTTVANLQTARVENISRGAELGLGVITEGAVHSARN